MKIKFSPGARQKIVALVAFAFLITNGRAGEKETPKKAEKPATAPARRLALKPGGRLVVLRLCNGEIVRGRIVGMAQGIYRIQPVTPQAPVRRIAAGDVARLTFAADAKKDGKKSQKAALQDRVLSFPAVASLLASLGGDPQILEVLQDPEIQRDLEQGNYLSLMRNKKILALGDNPAIKTALNTLLHRKKSPTPAVPPKKP